MSNPAKPVPIGLIFFLCYGVVYTCFVLVSAFRPAFLERQIGGVNLAVLSGVGLILAAIILAVLYCWICREQGDPS